MVSLPLKSSSNEQRAVIRFFGEQKDLMQTRQEFVRPRWPYDMRPSARAEKYMCVIVIR